MEWMEIVQQIFEVCVVPLLGILTASIVRFIALKKQEFIVNNDSALADKYADMLAKTITDCVIATNQTYVGAMKEKNAFDKAAQQEAFRQTYDAVIRILSDEAKDYLAAAYGDLATYITKKIEAEVNCNK